VHPEVEADHLLHGNSLSQQKVLWEIQSSRGISLALQKHQIMKFSSAYEVIVAGECWQMFLSRQSYFTSAMFLVSGRKGHTGQEEMLLL